MKNIKNIIFDSLCEIGRNPLTFIIGCISTSIGFILGAIIFAHIK
jgi:hypothetical protein